MPNGSTGNWTVTSSTGTTTHIDVGEILRGFTAITTDDSFEAPLAIRSTRRRDDRSNRTLERISRLIRSGDRVSKSDLAKYTEMLRQMRHVSKDERRYLHRPKDDNGKTTARVSVDDIRP